MEGLTSESHQVSHTGLFCHHLQGPPLSLARKPVDPKRGAKEGQKEQGSEENDVEVWGVDGQGRAQ